MGAVGLAAAGTTIAASGSAGKSEGDGGSGRSATVIDGFSIGASANGTSAERSGGGGVAGGERGADLAELLPGQAQPGEGAIAIARLEGFHAADGLERLRGFLEAAELELRLAPEQERAGAKSVVVARGRRLGLSRRLSPLLSLEGSFREVVRRLMSERMIGVFLAKTGPGRLLV